MAEHPLPASHTSLDPEQYRPDFPILSTVLYENQPLVYLDNAATTQRPRAVIDKLVQVYESLYANVHRGVHWLSDQSTDLFEESRERVRTFIHAPQRHEVIFTTGTTSAINLVARSWGDANVKAGDEILLTELEHHSNIVPWQQLAERTGCRVRFAPITAEGFLDLPQFHAMLSERTRMVAISAVSNVLGTINPIQEIVAAAHRLGAVVLVDAAQSAPHQRTDVQAWDADFVAFSGHKMLGPSGIGILYGRESLLEAMPPFLGGGNMIRRVTVDGFEAADLPAKFEAGTPPIVPAIGLGAAIDYLNQVGLERIHDHELMLTEYAHQILAEVGDITMLGPPPGQKAGIVSFVVDRVHAHDVAQILDARGIAIRAGHHCAMPLHKRLKITASNRASFYFYNTRAEVEKLGEALGDCKRLFRRKKQGPA
ncbi:MAG: putative cysteine desulfurase [Planctomycetota bacterium]|jgi:cysteine desulfurase/selenocysteine lyase